jgi:SAM-dependent methyltransferase
MDTATLQEEAAFADREYSPHADTLQLPESLFARYARPRQWWDWRQFAAKLLGNVRGRTLLDYGCGMGEEAVCFARLGADVTAIDVSPVGVRLTHDRAAVHGVAHRVNALVMDATATAFPDDSFDLVHGLGILHHVGLRAGLAEVRRVLKPGGTGVFLEPMGNVKVVERCKRWLHRRLVDRLALVRVNDQEENLRLRDINACADLFSDLRVYPYRLLHRVRKLIAPRFLHGWLERVDYYVLRAAPFLRRLAGAAVICVRK